MTKDAATRLMTGFTGIPIEISRHPMGPNAPQAGMTFGFGVSVAIRTRRLGMAERTGFAVLGLIGKVRYGAMQAQPIVPVVLRLDVLLIDAMAQFAIMFGHGDLFLGVARNAGRPRHHDFVCLLFFGGGFFMAG